uniref:Bromodomain containing 7 n=1 Tax=Oreochromis niloticus TaxID=8128 RepID=A0A669D4G8_ORENI
MGKKHKKHKSEKHGYEEYGDRPLKLVLKVSGNEVTTGSSSLDTFYDEQPADFDKPKDKKKKKKKDKEKSFGSPEEEKGKKKVTKKKKGQDADGDDDREQSRTPIRSEIDKQEEKEQTPLQEALNQLIRQLQRKDPNAFFSFPVTDLIAPGYSAVIKRPMDFSTMKDKVKKECYQSLDELKVDFRIMCENAMIYNKPETIYHKAARKLLHSGMKILSQLEFARRKSDGSTTLAILNPADPSAGDVGYCPVKLGMMSNRLQSGVNTLQGFREDKRNRITPVSYMNYGPFTSYAPTYDSSFANISKEDSDLIYSFYGDESSLQGSDSLSEFLAKSEEYVYKLADNFLDAVTNGEHSRILKDTETRGSVSGLRNSGYIVLEMIGGVPEGNWRNSEEVFTRCVFSFPHTEALNIQQKLDETTKLLRNLQEVQRERLSAKQPPNMICLLAPTAKELELAEKVTSNLAELTSQVAPCDVSSIYGIRKAMGIAAPPDPPELFIDLTTDKFQRHRK